MPSITRKCRINNKEFVITEKDQKFYEKIGVPLPTLCPEERERRRIVWRNERHLFTSDCTFCRKIIISMYDPETVQFPVYCNECFWGANWNPLDYGQEIDFSRPFFDQFADLLKLVPRIFLFTANSINSEYTLNSIWNKNCYLTSGSDYNEDCFYGINSQRCRDCTDMYFIFDSEKSYGCIDCEKVYNSIGCQNSEFINDSWFLYDCKSCQDCAFSSNLRNKKYVLFNEQLSEDEYKIKLRETLDTLFDNPNWLEDNMRTVRENAVHRSARIINGENCLGNNIKNSQNAHYCYDVENLQDCKYAFFSVNTKDSYDISCAGWKADLLYEVSSAGDNVYNVKFSNAVINSSDISYSASIWNSRNIFGSVSLHDQNQYVILNKQYSKEQYENLSKQLIQYMKVTGEWGEFFPAQLSPFEYNRSMAVDHMPLTQEQALERQHKWHDEGYAYGSDHYEDFLSCAGCKKPYRPIKQELNFYQSMRVPIPKYCWPCRLVKYKQARKPQKLFKSTCKSCNEEIVTPTSPDQELKVYCEKCYLKEVY